MEKLSSGDAALQAMSEAVLAITAELSVERVLQKMVDAARELAGARYAALGVPDDEDGFDQFITSGISDNVAAAIGPLPRTHGMLGAMLHDTAPYRATDIQDDPRFIGWPYAHPDMRSFLGVPIVSKGEIIGAFYLTEKEGGGAFGERDQELIEMLAAHAAIAIEHARLYERIHELAVVEERNRLARDLHDSVNQKLFSVVLTAEAVVTLIDREPAQAKEQLRRLQELTREAVQEMRSLIFELRSAELESDGLVATLGKHIDVLRRVKGVEIDFRVDGERRLAPDTERTIYRVAQEALTNALKHSGASRIDLTLDMRAGRAALSVRDDGCGFEPDDPQVRANRLGLTSMRERADAAGAVLSIESHPGAGTTVRLEAPVG